MEMVFWLTAMTLLKGWFKSSLMGVSGPLPWAKGKRLVADEAVDGGGPEIHRGGFRKITRGDGHLGGDVAPVIGLGDDLAVEDKIVAVEHVGDVAEQLAAVGTEAGMQVREFSVEDEV